MDAHPVHGPVHGPVDPDVTPDDVETSAADHALVRDRLDVLGVIALGGALGAAARHLAGEAWPHPPGAVPWATLGVNVTGSFLLGLLMFYVSDVWPPRRYVRPFLGVGVLGGFTTFSAYALETRALLAGGHLGAALAYLVGTLVLALGAVVAGAVVGRVVARTGRVGS